MEVTALPQETISGVDFRGLELSMDNLSILRWEESIWNTTGNVEIGTADSDQEICARLNLLLKDDLTLT